jgi:hypothetical protein
MYSTVNPGKRHSSVSMAVGSSTGTENPRWSSMANLSAAPRDEFRKISILVKLSVLMGSF